MVYVQGYEFSEEFAEDMHPQVVWILGHVARFGAAVIELDGSNDAVEIRHQLEYWCEDYFDILKKGDMLYCIDASKFEIPGPMITLD